MRLTSVSMILNGVAVIMNIKIGDKVSLEGISKKGKERIKQWGGDGWIVTKIADNVIFSSEPGPWLFVENGNDRASRWIHEKRDSDFKLIVSCPSDGGY